MRLYSGQFNLIANDIIKALLDAELLELDAGKRQEAELDMTIAFRRLALAAAGDAVGDDGGPRLAAG